MPYTFALALQELDALCQETQRPGTWLYAEALGILQRACLVATSGSSVDFSSLFSRLFAVCAARHLDHRRPDRFRRQAHRVQSGAQAFSAEQWQRDAEDLRWFLRQLAAPAAPDALQSAADAIQSAPDAVQSAPDALNPEPAPQKGRTETLRAVVVSLLEDGAGFLCETDGGASIHVQPRTPDVLPLLEVQTVVGLWHMEEKPSAQAHGRKCLLAEVVVEPDCLHDVTAVSTCFGRFGARPELFFLHRFQTHNPTAATLLGEAANAFMEASLHAEPTADVAQLYAKAMRTLFEQHALAFAALPDEEVGKSFFDEARRQCEAIFRMVHTSFPSPEMGIQPADALLETEFISPALGLRGRFDVLTADHRRVVELKSGRAEEYFGHAERPRPEHEIQMSLYREMLRLADGQQWYEPAQFLVYSRYPHIYGVRAFSKTVAQAILMRNRVVWMERQIARGRFHDLFDPLTADDFNPKGTGGRLWTDFYRPELAQMLATLQQAEPLARKYFAAFLPFLQREQFLAKTCDNRPDSGRGFARTWTATASEKARTGDLLRDLVLQERSGANGIEDLTFRMPYADASQAIVPNFSEGETVLLYAADTADASVERRQVFRAFIRRLEGDTLALQLAFPQRAERLFPIGGRFAVEHDHLDTTFTLAHRGLYALLAAPAARRALLLGQRAPEGEFSLVVGPPGTGKTNRTMRQMVLERRPHERLLLLAYTNRAVDEICSMLEGIGGLDYVRIGSSRTCAPQHRPHLLEQRVRECRNRDAVRQLLRSVPVVVGTVVTLSGQTSLLRLLTFDLAIFDEASQLLEPQVLLLLCARDASGKAPAIKRFTLIGDHKQLPSVVCLPSAQTRVDDADLQAIGLTDLRQSLFQRLHTLCRMHGWHDAVHELTHQGRMHPDIAAFPSAAFYGGHLLSAGLPHQTARIVFRHPQTPLESVLTERRACFFDVEGSGSVHASKPSAPASMPRSNPAEAEAVVQVLEAMHALALRAGQPLDWARQVGIIVPFRAQIGTIRAALRRSNALQAHADALTIDTVECYQGSTRDYILFSATVTRPYQLPLLSEPVEVEGQAVDRKLNVALTRARLGLYVFGCRRVLEESPIYARLIAALSGGCGVKESPEGVG